MAFDLGKELEKLTSGITNKVTSKAKESAISTLNDPEFKATVNQFTEDWFNKHRVVLSAVVGSFFILSLLAIVNIISNFRVRR